MTHRYTVEMPIDTGPPLFEPVRGPTVLILPAKSPADVRLCELDCRKWLDAAETRLSSYLVYVLMPLVITNKSLDNGSVLFTVRGGAITPPNPISVTLITADGGRENVNIIQPVVNNLRVLEVTSIGPGEPEVPDYDSLTAGAAISGHRALMFNQTGAVVHADPMDPIYQFAGISLQPALPDELVQSEDEGIIVEPTWAWTPGLPIYVANDGALTQSVPVAGWAQQLGVAVSPTSMLVQPYQPIFLLA